MNKKLRVLFCMLFAAIAVFALALVACDQDNSDSSTGSEASSTDDTGNTETNTGTDDTETENPDTTETDEPITITVTTSYDSDYSRYYAEYEYTVTTAGSYRVALTSPADTDAYIAIYINGEYNYDYVDYTTTDNITVAANDVLTIYLYDFYAEAVADYTVTITPFTVTATIPTALTIPGDTVASLDNTGYEYDLYYTVTDATAGEYTFTLSGDDLTNVTVYINGYGNYITLSSTSKTATIILPSGSTLNVSASVPSTTETAIAFTLNTAIDTSVESREGYYAEDPIELYSYVGYDYDEDLTVTADDTLYFKITGSNLGVDLTLTVTSSDATFKVYGCTYYTTEGGDITYTELTLTEGSYSFSLSSTRYVEYIKIVPSTAGSINVTIEEVEEVVEIVYTALSLDTETTLSASANYTFTAETDGTYVFAVGATSDVYIADVDYFVDSTAYSENNWDIFSGAKEAIELSAGDKLYISCYNVFYDNSTLTIYLQKSLSYTATLDSDNYSATTTFTITDAGYYAVSVSGAESSYYVSISDDNNTYYYNTSNTYCGYIIDYSASGEVPISILAGTVLNVVIGYYGSDTVTITATLTLDPLYTASSGDSSDISYTEVELDTEFTITGADVYKYAVEEDGTYIITVDGDIYVGIDSITEEDDNVWGSPDSDSYTLTEGQVVYFYNYDSTDSESTVTIAKKAELVIDYVDFGGTVYNISSYTDTSVSDGTVLIENVLTAVGGNMFLGTDSGDLDIDDSTVVYEGVDLTTRVSTSNTDRYWTLTVAANSTVTIYYALSNTAQSMTVTASGETDPVATLTTNSSDSWYVMSATLTLTAGTYNIAITGGTGALFSIAVATTAAE